MKAFFTFLMLSFYSACALAGLDEFSISTKDKTCAIHYLTKKTKYNWTIDVDSYSCKNGWVNGFAEVKIYSPTKQLTETLSGFFIEGYWLESFPSPTEIIERTSPKERVQTISFLLGKDEEANIIYVGQLRAIQPENRAYGPFQGCPDFKVLVVVPDKEMFNNPAFQETIIHQGLKYAHSFCKEPETLSLFGATEMKSPKIIFKMQVDCATKERVLFPVEENAADPAHMPLEIKKENAEILLAVEPGKKAPTVSYTPPSAESTLNKEGAEQQTPLKDLQILSKMAQSMVKGRSIVHIEKILLDGTGITDLPDKVKLLHYPNLKTGWAVVEGIIKEDEMRLTDIQFCQKEWCTDVP